MPRSTAASTSRSASEVFKLTVRADRIELLKDGRYAVLDYKTGAPPSDKQVLTGLSPQLTLEAAIMRAGRLQGYSRRRLRGAVGLCAVARRRHRR